MDCHGPELTYPERLGALIRSHKCLQRLEVEPTVGMGHVSPRQPVYPRVSSQMVAVGDLRQELVEAARQVVADFPDLPVDNVEVVEKPLFGLRDLALLPNYLDDVPVSGEKHLTVLPNTGKQAASLFLCPGRGLGRGQALRVLREAFDAEHFGPDRQLHLRRSRDDGVHFEFGVGSSQRARSIK